MGSRCRVAGSLLALCFGLSLWSPSARADEPQAGTRMAARELAVSGAEAFDKQDYATALDRFQRAESLYKVPSIAVMVARCLARVGRVVEAVDKYEETLRMPLDAAAPEAFQRAVADATAEVEGVRGRVARVVLRTPPDNPPELEVTIDDRVVPKALWGVPTPLNPGLHRIMARAAGREPFSYDVSLPEGAKQTVDIRLPALQKAETQPGNDAVRPLLHERQQHSKSNTLPIVLLAGGGVALAAGVVTGVAALNHKSTLDDHCTPGCPADMSSDLDGFRLMRTFSYVGFGVGAVAAGAGAYLLLHESSSGSQVGALLLPGGASVTGTF